MVETTTISGVWRGFRRRLVTRPLMSALCQKQTSAYLLFDHLVGPNEQRRRHSEAKSLGRFAHDKAGVLFFDGPGRREAAGSRRLMSFVFGRRWWLWADIAPGIGIFVFCVRNHFSRRLVVAINFSVVVLFLPAAQNISVSRQSRFIRLSGSGSYR